MRKSAIFAAVALVVVAGCKVKETEDAEGDKKYEVAPATVEVGTDTATVKVPTVDIKTDSTPDTTTTR